MYLRIFINRDTVLKDNTTSTNEFKTNELLVIFAKNKTTKKEFNECQWSRQPLGH